jgi:chorismate-pyruvate lyase
MLEPSLQTAPAPTTTLRQANKPSMNPAPEDTTPPWTDLLRKFYEKAGLSLPRIVCVEPRQMPVPCRRLLAHNNDMTPTLEKFFGESVALQVCSRQREGDTYLREVVLALADSGTPVEYGAIRIHLKHFPGPVRRRILADDHPFGRILQEEGIAHLGWPQAFFWIQPDDHMRRLLGFDQARPLHGRRNVLLDGRRRLLAEVIEILAPLEIEPYTT